MAEAKVTLTNEQRKIIETSLNLSKTSTLRAMKAYQDKGQTAIADQLRLEADKIDGCAYTLRNLT